MSLFGRVRRQVRRDQQNAAARAPELTTERLLCGADAFGLTTATACQRAACRILDGLPVAELAADPDVSRLAGGQAALEQLPRIPPRELVLLAAIRSAKTMLACAAAVRMSQSVDVSGLKPGEVPRVSIVSLKLDNSAVAKSILSNTLSESPLLRDLVIGETAECVTLRHPTGRPVEVAIVAGSKAGKGLVSRWAAGVVFDEAPRMSGQEDGVVNLDDARSAVLGRLLPGAQILYVGSPWAAFGPIFDLVQAHEGKPSEAMVILRGSGPMLNPVWWNEKRIAEVLEADPTGAYVTDVLADFAAPEAGLLNPLELKSCTRAVPLHLESDGTASYTAACDPSEGSVSGNAWTLVIIRTESALATPSRRKVRVALTKQYRGQDVDDIWKDIAQECRRYRCSVAYSDKYAAAASVALARRHGLLLEPTAWTTQEKFDAYSNLASLVRTGAIELSPDEVLRRDLLSVRKKRTQAGWTITLPLSRDGRHADYAPALTLAVSKAGIPNSDKPVMTVSDMKPEARERYPVKPVARMRRPV